MFPFKPKEIVNVKIAGRKLVIEKIRA